MADSALDSHKPAGVGLEDKFGNKKNTAQAPIQLFLKTMLFCFTNSMVVDLLLGL